MAGGVATAAEDGAFALFDRAAADELANGCA